MTLRRSEHSFPSGFKSFIFDFGPDAFVLLGLGYRDMCRGPELREREREKEFIKRASVPVL